MDKNAYKGYIGVFDSGVGGISILRELVHTLPHENFVFFGDSARAPYGEKSPQEVLAFASDITASMLEGGCKAVVIACNTATSAAVDELRAQYPEVPLVGVEPALKPAVLAERLGRVLVMATPLTVCLAKFRRLMDEWGNQAEVIAVPCAGLAARIEQGALDAPDVYDLLRSLVGQYAARVDAVVLGCTHYPFVAKQIRDVVGDVPFFDSASGTARQLRRLLGAADMLERDCKAGDVVFLSSMDTPEELALYRRFFEMDI